MSINDVILRNDWHPVAWLADLQETPIAVEVLGEKVVIFRTSLGIHAFKDLCIHRGVPLSLGHVKGDELVCAYHGWAYDACGKCTRIPSMPPTKAIPTKAKTVTYSCIERYDLIWVCIGEPNQEQPEVGIGKLMNADTVKVKMTPYHLHAAGPRVIENFLDVSHLMYVHEGLLGDSEYSEIGDYLVQEIGGVLTTDEIDVFQPDPDGRGYGVHTKYMYEVYRPLSASLTKRSDGTEEYFHLFLFVLPENEQQSTAFMIMERNYAYDEPDETFKEFQDRLIEQDREIVENQRPELLPLDLQAELHLTCDRLSIAYRKMLKEVGVTFGTE